MPFSDVSDYVIRYKGHPKYMSTKVVEDDAVEVVLQKLEMLLFTNQNEVMGDAGFDFGGNLEYMLWSTALPNNIMKMRLINQINKYIPEMPAMGYTLDIKLYDGPVYDAMDLDFVIKGYNISYVLQK